MPIKWKSSDRFKPSHILDRIDSVRSVNDEGQVSYSGLVIDECIPILHSMLQFPPVAVGMEQEMLVWKALNLSGKELTSDTFLNVINQVLSEKLTTKEQNYIVLTTISLIPNGLINKIKFMGCEIEFQPKSFPKKFIESRKEVIKKYKADIPETPSNYCQVIIKIRAKSDNIAFHKAMRALDLIRAIMCLMANSRMQYSFGTPLLEPINKIRLGGYHTVHLMDGMSARKGYWYEPNFITTKPHAFDNLTLARKNILWAIKKIEKSKFENSITSSLLRFVRGLDQNDHNSAFLKLWSALEILTTPNVADYDKLIRRSSFLFKDNAYHRQVLEHLRAYRNANVHAGEDSENARIYCFQLQTYYAAIAWFCIRNESNFKTLEDLGVFLDLPIEQRTLNAQLKSIKRAIKFFSPLK